MNGSYWTGDEWRWGMRSSGYRQTIMIIEPPDAEPSPRKANTPFGFSRALPAPEVEPLIWEGDGA